MSKNDEKTMTREEIAVFVKEERAVDEMGASLIPIEQHRLALDIIEQLQREIEAMKPILEKLINGRCACITHEGDPQEYRCDICREAKVIYLRCRDKLTRTILRTSWTP